MGERERVFNEVLRLLGELRDEDERGYDSATAKTRQVFLGRVCATDHAIGRVRELKERETSG